MSEAFNFILYADDATLFTTIGNSNYDKNIDESQNNELLHVFKWLVINIIYIYIYIYKNKFLMFRP